MKRAITFLLVAALASIALADTYTQKHTGEKYTGFTTNIKKNGLIGIKTIEKGMTFIDIENFTIELNHEGRRDQTIIVSLDDGIKYTHETNAFMEAIENAANRGVKQIIIEIDSPGGYVHLCKKMCNKISEIKYICPISAFISGGEYNGAYSAGAAVALSCPQIYMAPNTAIGAATPYVINKYGKTESDNEFRQEFRDYFGDLARRNNKPRLLAMAMVDKDFDVREVTFDGQRHFWSQELNQIYPKPKNAKEREDGHGFLFNVPQEAPQRVWSEKGQILTLSAADSETTGISNGSFDSLPYLLQKLGVASSKVMHDRTPLKARKEYEKAAKRVQTVMVRVDQRIDNFKDIHNRDSYITQLTRLSGELREIIELYERYPDLRQTGWTLDSVRKVYHSVQRYLH